MQHVTLHPFAEAHIDAALALSQAAGWPHGRGDWEMLLPMSQGFVACEGDRVIGTALRSNFGPDLSTLNMVLVADDRRQRGIGRTLAEAVMAGRSTRTWRLIATPSGRPLYERLGFVTVGEIMQFQGVVKAAPAATPLIAAHAKDRDALRHLEGQSFGADRAALTHWLMANATLAVHRGTNGALTGYAARRPFARGQLIGPVVATSLESAGALVSQLSQGLRGVFLRLDITDERLSPLLRHLGLDHVTTAPVMQRGPATAAKTRFAIASQALG
ncbi:MAG: GNAT family N-acetyltransferase [Pseudomonadota bacterium]